MIGVIVMIIKIFHLFPLLREFKHFTILLIHRNGGYFVWICHYSRITTNMTNYTYTLWKDQLISLSKSKTNSVNDTCKAIIRAAQKSP